MGSSRVVIGRRVLVILRPLETCYLIIITSRRLGSFTLNLILDLYPLSNRRFLFWDINLRLLLDCIRILSLDLVLLNSVLDSRLHIFKVSRWLTVFSLMIMVYRCSRMPSKMHMLFLRIVGGLAL